MTIKKFTVDMNKASQHESIDEYSKRMYAENKELKGIEKAKEKEEEENDNDSK